MPGAGDSQAIDKKYLDFIEACNRCHCGCCKDGCPIYGTMLEEQISARGRNSIIRAYLVGEIEPDARMARAVYSCLLCRLDEESCGARIPNAEIYEYIRERLFSLGIGPLPEHEPLLASLRNYGNPWMQPKSARERWVRQGKAGKKDSKKDLYFAGCTFSLAPELASVPIAVMRLLALAGEDFAVLGQDETCCGSTALRVGDRKLFEHLSEENAKRISKYDRVVTSCAGCYKTIGQDYKGKAVPKQLMHSVEILSQLIESGKLRPKELKAKVTYHDPCHLGRHSKLYDSPRYVIKSIPGVELVEMKNSRELARCCGAGAGVKTANPLVSLDIAKRRVTEAVQTGAHILVSACPFCEQNLKEAASAMNSNMRVMDISELLLESCE
jgi:heterodisulfide reductase subunit D